MKGKSKIHYSWMILFASLMITTFYMSIVLNCQGLFLIPASETLGVSRSQYSINSTMIAVAMIIVSINAGKIFAKFNIKKIMSVAAIILPIAYACYGIVDNIYVFYIISFIVGSCFSLCGFVPISTLISNWFIDSRSFALGIAFTGSGLGGMLFQPIISKLIIGIGWQKTYIVLAVFMFIFVVPCVLVFIKDSPEDIGFKPYEKPNKQGKQKQKIEAESEGVTLNEAFKSVKFWVFLVIAAATTGACTSFIQILVPYTIDLGYSLTKAANMGALSLGALAVGKAVVGRIYDKWGTLNASILSLLLLSLSFIAFLFAENQIYLYIAIIFFGIGGTFSSVGFSSATLGIFGKKDYGAIYGYSTAASSLGSAIGSPSANLIYDLTNSYKLAWLAWAIIVAISLVVCTYIIKNKNEY